MGKDYKKLYKVYWWKYKILEDYVLGLRDRLDKCRDEIKEFHYHSELDLIKVILASANQFKEENEGQELVDKAREDFYAKVKEANERLTKITEEYEKGGWHSSV